MLLKSTLFKDDVRTIKKQTKIIFKNDITIISGDNGSGKSTIVQSILKKLSPDNKVNFDHNINVGIDVETTNIEIETSENYQNNNIIYLDTVEGLLKNLSYIDDEQLSLQISCMNKS